MTRCNQLLCSVAVCVAVCVAACVAGNVAGRVAVCVAVCAGTIKFFDLGLVDCALQ